MKLDPHSELQITECFGRDGLQSLPQFMPTADKVAMLNRIVDAGFARVELTSLVPARLLPQFADAYEVHRQVRRRPGVRYITFCPNARGAQSALELEYEGYAPTDLLIVISASQSHNRRNLNAEWDETRQQHERIFSMLKGSSMRVIGSISTSFGCPYEGPVALDAVLRFVEHYLSLGAVELQFGDTTGVANPMQVETFFDTVYRRFPGLSAVAHFHDTRGTAIANTLVAMECGVRIVDTALGGTGGRPPSQRLQLSGPTGNVCTEDFVAMLEQMDYPTGLDARTVWQMGVDLEVLAGQPLHSHTVRAGLVEDLKPAG